MRSFSRQLVLKLSLKSAWKTSEALLEAILELSMVGGSQN